MANAEAIQQADFAQDITLKDKSCVADEAWYCFD